MELLGYELSATLALSVVNYYATTFTIWFGHWFSHLPRSPFRGFHVLGHHVLYPTSRDMLSRRFRYGSGRHDSIVALIPWLILHVAVLHFVLSVWLFLIVFAETVVLTVLYSYVHVQFHLRGSALARFDWFLRAREAHAVHHDRDTNYMVADHFWDRRFGTYSEPDREDLIECPAQYP